MPPCKFLDDKPRCGRPYSVVNYWKSTEADEEVFLENRVITVEELASELDVSVGSAFVFKSHCNNILHRLC